MRLELLDHPDSLPLDPDLVLSIDELLTATRAGSTAATQVAHLHLFGGLSIEKAGETLGLSRAVAYRNWTYARAWLAGFGKIIFDWRETLFRWMGH